MHLMLKTKFVLAGGLAIMLAVGVGSFWHSVIMAWGVGAAYHFLLAVIPFLLLLPFIYLLLDRWIFRPLARIIRANELVVAGDLEGALIREEYIPQGELGALMRTRNRVLDMLLGQQRALEEEIATRERAQEALLASENKYRLLFEQAHDSIFIIDASTRRFLEVNENAAGRLGYTREELLRLSFDDLHEPAAAARNKALVEELLERGALTFEHVHRRKDGTPMPVEISAQVIEYDDQRVFQTAVRDLTARRALEAQLRHAQKMEAVGQLAGGVAHDFNNLLTVIMGCSALLLMDLEADDPRRQVLEEIQEAGNRATTLTRRLLTFSRQQPTQPQVLNLNEAIIDMEKMLRRLISEDIVLKVSAEPGPEHVKIDPGQLEQVIMNLVINARDAMADGGTLTIETANVELDEVYTRSHLDAQAGRYVMIAVSDTGTGMDADTRSRIFEPFFTTKAPGEGTGLGLSTVYGIIKESRGHIQVRSEPGQGARFEIYLPRVEEALPSAERDRAGRETFRGSETILVVEDEEGVRKFVRQVLEIAGYTVLEACEGEEALQVCKRYEGSIHLLVTDMVMPRMNGPELVERLRAGHPEVRALYMSGHVNHPLLHTRGVKQGEIFLQKPFTPEVLTRRVRKTLDAGLQEPG